MTHVLLYLAPFVIGLILTEVVDTCPWLALKVIRWAAQRIPDRDQAQTLEEEWTALLDERPGKLLKLALAMTFIIPSLEMRRDLTGRASWSRRVLIAHTSLWTGKWMGRLMLLSLASFIPLQMLAESMPTPHGTPTAYYWVCAFNAGQTLYLILGLGTYKRHLRQLRSLALSGDDNAREELVLQHELWHGTTPSRTESVQRGARR